MPETINAVGNSTIHLDVKEDDPNIKTYIPQTDQERYDWVGFKNLEDLKKYGKLLNKAYEGTDFAEAYKIIFGKDLGRHVGLRKYRRKLQKKAQRVNAFDKRIIKNSSNRFLEYSIILNTFKPKFWISAFYSNGLVARTDQVHYNSDMNFIEQRVLTNEISGNKCYISKENWEVKLSNNVGVQGTDRIPYIELTEKRTDIIKSTFEFGSTYTIIAVAKRLSDGRVITSSVGNKYVFYHADQMRRCYLDLANGERHMMLMKSKPDDSKIHLIIYTVDGDVRTLYDNDKLIFTDVKSGSSTNFGNIVVGDMFFNECASAYIYEVIGFNTRLSDESLDMIRYIFGKYMSF